MSDQRESGEAGGGLRPANPLLVLLNPMRSPLLRNAPPDDAEAARHAEKARVMGSLLVKSAALDDAAAALVVPARHHEDRGVRDRATNQLNQARQESDLCMARYYQIAADDPFVDPGEDQELIDAIRAVEQAMANTAAVGELIQATLDLVQTYQASAT